MTKTAEERHQLAEAAVERPRLIEVAFPLKQTSIDSVHEKNVRHGHISTLHIWPARRPLAAARSALIATLLPDPGTASERKALLERIGGALTTRVESKKDKEGRSTEVIREETRGGVLHWGRESNSDIDWFRERIKEAYGGRSPRVLDPFAGGGAIPLEAMRLGCEVTAIDINPVAWFALKCTLDYPQRLAGRTHPLPSLTSGSTTGKPLPNSTSSRKKVARGTSGKAHQASMFESREADLVGHVRAWGNWVLEEARKELAAFYPTVGSRPTVAFLWARTVECKNCRTAIPLLKTAWLCKKEGKRVVLHIQPAKRDRVPSFDVRIDVPPRGQSASQRREYDRKVGKGTMSRAGATCPACKVIATMEDIRFEGKAGRIGSVMTAVVVDGADGKEYRLPTPAERTAAHQAEKVLAKAFKDLPFGVPTEPITTGSIRKGTVSVTRWGFDSFRDLFNPRQLLALGTFTGIVRRARAELRSLKYPEDWVTAINAYLAATLDRLANQCSAIARWNLGGEKIEGTFAMFALPMMWDYAEVNPIGDTSGGYAGAVEWVAKAAEHLLDALRKSPAPTLLRQSAAKALPTGIDVIVTDPPYYDAIPYASLMDFFYIWLRRSVSDLSPEFQAVFDQTVVAQWNKAEADGELIDDESRFGGDNAQSKAAYEEGMFKAFRSAFAALVPSGRLVIVFAHKKPDAWETLVSAIIRAGFVVDGSWPIQTERVARGRSLAGAALSSSVWLVCRKRPESAKPGWDNRVLEEMRERIHARLKDFWDAGIRGPDFVWSATGPALESYSRHPVVKKANDPGQVMGVSEFLQHVRRIVVDYVVGRVLSRDGAETVSGLDDVTTYYLLHRNDFGFGDAPAGACILYAVSCGLSDHDLTDNLDLLVKTGAGGEDEESSSGDSEESSDSTEGTGNKLRLKGWEQRKRKGLGFDADGRVSPLVDQVHRLLHLWRAGDVSKVDEYIEGRAIKKSQLFHQLLQALIELAETGSEERSLLESISKHISSKPRAEDRQLGMFQS